MSEAREARARQQRRDSAQDYTTAMGSLVGALVGITLWDTLPLLPRIVIVAWWVGAGAQLLLMLSDLFRWVRRP